MTSRPPIPAQTAVLDVAIVGAGFGGMCMAIKLLEEGNRNFLIVEKGSEVGGTWRDNSYPGAACDVQSHLYSFSFAPNPGWTHSYSRQPEILAYLRHCARHFGLLSLRIATSAICPLSSMDGTLNWEKPTSAAPRRFWVAATSR